MSKLREYKSVVFWLIFVSLWIVGCDTCCKEDYANEIENQNEINNKNNIDGIINEMKDNHTWTIFKFTITPGEVEQNIDNQEIKYIVSKDIVSNEYIDGTNPLLLNEEQAQKIKETMEINNNENININNENININNGILKDENSKDNNKSTYYVLVKDIRIREYEDDLYIPLFKKLEENAQKDKFTYTIEIFAANTTGVKDMSGMFKECNSLQSIDLSGWKTDNVTDMSGMFSGCNSLQTIDLSGWNTGNVTTMSWMFNGCKKLVEIKGLENWDTKNVTNMNCMFYECKALTKIKFGANWHTENVTDMSHMFSKCEKLTEIKGIENWNPKNVTDMRSMFCGCKFLKFEKQEIKLSIKPQQCNINSIIDKCDNLSLKDNCIQNKES